jgi:hypothetical protein
MTASCTEDSTQTVSGQASMAHGYAVNTPAQGAIGFNALQAATHAAHRQGRLDRCLTVPQNTSLASLWSVALASFGPTSMTLNFPDVDPSNSYFGWALVFSGSLQAMQWTDIAPSSPGVQNIVTGPSLQFAMGFCNGLLEESAPAVATNISHSIGSATSAETQQCALFVDTDDVPTQRALRHWPTEQFVDAYSFD